MEIARGQRVKLQDLGLGSRSFVFEISLGKGIALDCACFALDAQRRLSDDRYMVFFNQPVTLCGAP